jgi:RNA processing factor Prp31
MSLTDIFNKEDFNKMIFNPFSIKGSIKKKYPKLKMFKTFDSANDSMIKYVLYMYDQNTPLKEQFPELKIRKEQAAVLSGFNLIKDNEKLHDVFFFLSDQLVDMVDEFLRKQNNRIWSMIVSNEQTFFEYQTKLLSPVEGDRDKDILQALQIKSKIMDDLNTINDRLDSYYMKLYGEDQELLKVIKADKRLTPEFIANL